jgi:hypothetical protein
MVRILTCLAAAFFLAAHAQQPSRKLRLVLLNHREHGDCSKQHN